MYVHAGRCSRASQVRKVQWCARESRLTAILQTATVQHATQATDGMIPVVLSVAGAAWSEVSCTIAGLESVAKSGKRPVIVQSVCGDPTTAILDGCACRSMVARITSQKRSMVRLREQVDRDLASCNSSTCNSGHRWHGTSSTECRRRSVVGCELHNRGP